MKQHEGITAAGLREYGVIRTTDAYVRIAAIFWS